MRPCVLLAAAVLVAAAAPLAAAPDEKDVAQKIADLGGTLTRDEKATGKPVVGVDLRGAEVSADLLRSLEAFAKLESPQLRDAEVNDDALAGLTGLKGLRSLDLDATEVTDAG